MTTMVKVMCHGHGTQIPFPIQPNQHKPTSIWIAPSKLYPNIRPGIRFPSIPTIRSSSDTPQPNTAAAADDDDGSPPNVFIKGFPLSTSEERLRKAFSEFGRVKRVKILIDMETGESLGRALIWLNKEEYAQLAVMQMNGTFFDGKFISVSTPKGSSIREKRDKKFKF